MPGSGGKQRVAVVRGDGIGPEITEATLRVLEATGIEFEWIEAPMGRDGRERCGTELPWESIQKVREIGLAIKAPLLAERMSGGVAVDDGTRLRHHASINNGLRRELGAYANLRPIRGWAGISGAYEQLDVVIVREVSEGIYSGIERLADGDTAEAVKRITRSGSRRIARFAFEHAKAAARRKVTAAHKANVLHLTDGMFLQAVREEAEAYPELKFDDQMVDAVCYLLVKSPKDCDVLVTCNQYGDILSDLIAGLAGSLGLAPGGNFGPDTAVFEASHGAAPDIAGAGVANPAGLILSGAMLLDHIGQNEAAGRVRAGVGKALAEGVALTPDLGGAATTSQLSDAICQGMQDA